jgi:hypothetical protein
MFYVPYNANIPLTVALLCGKKMMKLGCDKGEKWSLTVRVYKDYKIYVASVV